MSAIGAAIGTVASIGGSMLAAKSQKKAASQNRQAQRDSDQWNYDMFREGRGEGGSAVMPLYMNSANGGLFEQQLSDDMVSMWDATTPDRSAFDGVAAGYAPMVAGARRTAAGVFDGGTEREMLENFAPVAKGRVQFKRQSAIDALGKTLGEIEAMQARRGFSSDGMGSRMMKYRANSAAADGIAGANLMNLEEERAIRDSALQLRMSSLDLPFAMSGREADFTNFGNNAYLDAFQKRMVPLNFLRIGTGQPFQRQPLRYEATPSAGQLALQGVGQAAGAYTNYGMQNRQNDQWMSYLDKMQTNQQQRNLGFSPQQSFAVPQPPGSTGFDYTPNYNPASLAA